MATKAKAQPSPARTKTQTAQNQQDAVSLLKADHRNVEQLFAKFKSAGSSDDKTQLVKQICNELILHTRLEEELFYPACREKGVEHSALDEAQVEHDSAKVLIVELRKQKPDTAFYDAKVTVLSEYIKHHVGEEEKSSSGIFAKAKEAKVDMNVLGQQLQARKRELMAEANADGVESPKPRALEIDLTAAGSYLKENEVMERYERYRDDDRGRRSSRSNDRDRDERGRFMSDDDDDNGSGRSSSRSTGRDRYRDEGRFMSDEDRGQSRGRGSRSSERERDEEGRFMSDDNGGSRGGRSSRDDDYDDDRGRRGGEGRGWHGDPRGHAEAAREGREERRSSREYDDDADYRSSAGSRRSSRSDEDDDDRRSSGGRSQGGWFGDSEGHAEAARRGRDERGGSSRSRRDEDDDDDRRGSRSGGGWFGDSRGHAEAARRGWRNRD